MAYLNKSENNEKESKKRINNISNRIKRLEFDIKKIKSKEKDNTTSFNINNQYINSSDIKAIDDYNTKISKENKIDFQNKLLNNSVEINNNFNKFKMNKLCQKKTFKKINLNNYNNIINEKKKFFLKTNASNQKAIQVNKLKNKKDYLNNTKIRNSSANKIRRFFSFTQSYINHTDHRNNKEKKIIKYNFNNLEKLEYEFEVRNLKKKLNSLKNENNNINTKLNEIQIINKNLENSIYNNENEKNLLNDIIMLNRQYMINNNKNGNENEIEYDIDNINNQNNDNYNYALDNIILNIMDMKFNYDKNLLMDEFTNGINKLFNESLSNKNNTFDFNFNIKDNILEKINKIIDKNNNLNNSINKYKYLSKENNRYKNYCTYLINDLNLKNISELDKFIKDLYIQNIRENNQMRKLQITLMNQSSSKTKKVRKKLYSSSNKLISSVNKSIENTNTHQYTNYKYNYNKKSDSNINNKKNIYYLINRRKQNDLNGKILNRTEQLDNNHIINFKNLKIDTFYKKNKNELFSSEDKNYNYNKSSKKKINMEFYNQRNNNYGIKKIFNTNINQHSLFKNERNMEDIKYFNNIEKNRIGKQLNSNNFDRDFYGNVKNHSVIIFNK